ncbi:MAG: putative bifunctional diguanylate cyclase/phosphodiesterase [Beijerinckiaceae bacterium]
MTAKRKEDHPPQTDLGTFQTSEAFDHGLRVAEWSAVIDSILNGQPLAMALDAVSARLSLECGAGNHCFIVVRESDDHAVPAITNSAGQEARFAGLLSLAQNDATPAASVLVTGTPFITRDVMGAGSATPHALRARGLGFRAVVCVPVMDWNSATPVGAVAVYLGQSLKDEKALTMAATAAARCVSSLLQTRLVTQKAGRADNQMAALSSSIPGVVYQRRVRPDGDIRYTYISDSAFELFGVSAETILADPEALFRHYGDVYRENFKSRLVKASQEMQLWDVEATILRPDGQTRYTHAIARPFREPDGSVLWTGVILDATRIKEAEKATAAAESRTRLAIVESLSQGFLMFNQNDELELDNSHFRRLFPALEKIAVPGVRYEDMIRSELDPVINSGVFSFDANDELVDRLMRHGDDHLVYERQMVNDRYILVNEYRTAEKQTVVLYTDISELKRREKKIHHLAHHDVLTGLANRVLFREKLENAILSSVSPELMVAVLCLDLDRFKNVNDTLGHHIGDLLLQEVSKRIQSCLRGKDIAARLGGDEFAIIMMDVRDQDAPTSLAWRLLDVLAQPFLINDQTIVSGTSIGIAFSVEGQVSSEDILKNADLALYRAKSDGRGTFRFFEEEMDAKAQARRLLEIELRAAIALDHLEVHYQPQVDVYTAQMIGVEALVRWNHPLRGFIPPGDFIPLAEETGLIGAIGLHVLRRACQDAAKWPNDLRIAVNISPAQFKDKNFAQTVKDIVLESGLPPQRLEIEITESMLLRNTETNLQILHELKAFGIRVSMDDFGTGYSSLGNLRSFPFDKIKIDKSFINDLNKTPDAAAIIRAVLSLGRSLGMSTTAEGVETRDQLAYLRAEGCLEVQGHYYAKAMPAHEIEALIESGMNRVMSPSPSVYT